MLLSHNLQQSHFTLYNIAEVSQLAVHGECPGLQARDTEKVIDQLYHALTRGKGFAQNSFLGRTNRTEITLEQHVEITLDTG